jgi:septal ring factor EnvC (AmiA/AmiB activator)
VFPAEGQEQPVYTAWQRKNLEVELQHTLGELSAERKRVVRLEQELRAVRREAERLQRTVDEQRDRDSILLDIRERLSEGSMASGSSLSSHHRGGPCASVCCFFGRRRA